MSLSRGSMAVTIITSQTSRSGMRFGCWDSLLLALLLAGLATSSLAQSTTPLDGRKPAGEIVGDTGAPYENLFRPAHIGGFIADPKIGPGRLSVPILQISAPNYSLPLIERGFRPEEAEIKLGRLYVDFREASTSLLLSDNINASEFNRREGAISIVRLSMGLLLQINDGLQLGTVGSFVILPFRGEAGVNGFGITDPLDASYNISPVARAQLVYDFKLLGWDVRLLDEFDVTTPAYAANLQVDQQFEGSSFDEADTAGRYRYEDGTGRGRRGASTARDSGFNTTDLIYHNLAGVSAARLLPIDVEAFLGAFHHNYWYQNNRGGGGIRDADEIRSSLISQRENLRFKPFIRHESTTDNRRNGWDHQARGGIHGPISDYINFLAEYGRYWQDNSTASHSIWRVRLEHNPGPLTYHSIEYGRTITRPERTLATYLTYRLYRVIGPYLNSEAFYERLRARTLTAGLSGYTQWQTGLRLTYDLGSRTSLRNTFLYQDIENDNPASERVRNMIGRLEFTRSHTESFESTILYEFIDRKSSVAGNSYYENLLIYTLRKSF